MNLSCISWYWKFGQQNCLVLVWGAERYNPGSEKSQHRPKSKFSRSIFSMHELFGTLKVQRLLKQIQSLQRMLTNQQLKILLWNWWVHNPARSQKTKSRTKTHLKVENFKVIKEHEISWSILCLSPRRPEVGGGRFEIIAPVSVQLELRSGKTNTIPHCPNHIRPR